MNANLGDRANSRQSIFSRLLIYFGIAMILFTIGVFFYAEHRVETTIMRDEEEMSSVLHQKLQIYFSDMISDINFLVSQTECFYNVGGNKNKLLTDLLFDKFIVAADRYDQIRFVDNEGKDLAKANFDGEGLVDNDLCSISSDSDKYYFKEAIGLERGNVFFSKLDTDVVSDQDTLIYKPMIRIGAPVFDSESKKMGAIILNFLGEKLVSFVRERHTVGQTLLLNSDGYYYMATDSTKHWGTTHEKYNEKETLEQAFAKEGAIIFSKDKGSFTSSKGLFVFTSLHHNKLENKGSKGSETEWKIITLVTPAEVNMAIWQYYKEGFWQVAVSCLIIIVLLWILSGNIYQKREAQAALERSHRELEESHKALEESLRTKDKFFSIISHDLRSPFTGILGYTELLTYQIDELPKEQIKTFVNSVHESAQTTYKLLDNLLNWARVQTGKLSPTPESYSIKNQVEGIKEILLEAAKHKNIKITNNADDIYVFADSEMIAAVIRNFLSNAIKFTYRGGEITIESVIIDDDLVKLSVTDTGIGMSEDAANNVFSVDSIGSSEGTEKEAGTGLGLILCKDFVELNNGVIGVTSELNQGSTFYFTIPISSKKKRQSDKTIEVNTVPEVKIA